MIAFQEDGKTICYIRDISFHHMLKHPELLPEKKIADIIDAEAEQRKAHNAATRGRIMQRPKITEEPSPHPWLDPIIARAKFQNETIEKICGACPDCGGLGQKTDVDEGLVVADRSLSIAEGALTAWADPVTTRTNRWKRSWSGYYTEILEQVCRQHGIEPPRCRQSR